MQIVLKRPLTVAGITYNTLVVNNYARESSYAPGIYFTGQRVIFSGGLPPAAQSGYQTAQALCKDFGVEFVSR